MSGRASREWAANGGRRRSLLGRVTAALDVVVQTVTSLALFSIVIINTVEVVMRALLNHSFTWVQDTNLLLASCVYFLGIALVYERNADIAINIVPEWLPRRPRLTLALVTKVAGIVTFVTIGYFGLELVQVQLPFRTPTSGIPNALYTAPLVVGSGLMALSTLRQFIDLAAGRENLDTAA